MPDAALEICLNNLTEPIKAAVAHVKSGAGAVLRE